MPAPVSISIKSVSSSSSIRLLTRRVSWFFVRLFIPVIPFPPEIKPISIGPSVIISRIFLPWYIISLRLYLGIAPNITSTFASPISASKIITFFPSLRSWTARLTAIFDFPTPPFPLVIVMTLALDTERACLDLITFLSCSAWSILNPLQVISSQSFVCQIPRCHPAHSVLWSYKTGAPRNTAWYWACCQMLSSRQAS